MKERKAPSSDAGESSQTISLPRASEPPTAFPSRPTGLDPLASAPTTFGPSQTLGIPERLRSISRHNDPLGLTVLYEPETSPPLDVIFVHGLGGTSRATWAKGKDPEYFWPQKWLPFEPGLQTTRILSFGYNSNFAATGPAPITGIADFAKDLLFAMKFAKDKHSKELDLGQRPIFFIAHSMGGLVVKQAYLLGQNDQNYSTIVSSISAILFLATPHRGSNLAKVLNRILAVSIFNHTSKLYVSELKNGSQTIEALNDQFRHIAPKLDILSFYETLKTTVGLKKMMVVKKSSATLGYANEISKSLAADHHTICKFDSTQDSNYVSIINTLKTLVTAIRSKGRNSRRSQGITQIEQLETLLAVSETYQDDLEFFRKRWTPGTCDWICTNPSFTRWVDKSDEGPIILWLHALPASGKSILSSFLVNHLLEESFCVYYFFRFGDQSKRSLSTCLRTLAFQIAEQLPQFRRALDDVRFVATLDKTDAKTIWEKVFIGVLFKMRLTTTMYWVIDAIDESDHPQLLLEFMQSTPTSSAPIKVLLVSRQTPELISTFDRLAVVVPAVYLPLDDTKRDIRFHIENEVQYMHAPPESKSQLVGKLVARAVGNFLWASLALVEIMRCNTQEDLDEILEGIPSGMEHLYQRMERTIIEETRPRDQELGRMILTWAVCSRRPLVLKELAQALQPEFLVKLDLKFTISRVCGQFVVIDGTDQVVMVHQTARDHIIAADSSLAVNITEGHEKLLTKCLSVLVATNQGHHRPSSQKAPENQEFVRYAMKSWAYHLDRTTLESDVPLLALSNFLQGKCVLAWIVLLAQQSQLKVLVYSSKSMNLFVRRKRSYYTANNLLYRLRELDIIDSWATDFLKLVGKFGRNLIASPTSIYQLIPPFCPKKSIVYRQFEEHASSPHPLFVEGVSKPVWDDRLAKLSLGPESQALTVACSADHFALLTAAGLIVLHDSRTFEVNRTLAHEERACIMSFSRSSNLFVTYGFLTTKVWSVNTGQMIHQICNPKGSSPFTITFSADDTEVVIGSNDCLIRVARLRDPNPVWSILHPGLLRDHRALDRTVNTVPWRLAFNSDASYVAAAYRGSPLCVWGMNPPELIGRCMRNQEYAGNGWTVVDQIIWHPKSDEVLGLYMGGHVFRWNPYTNTQRELQAEASILSSSPDGNFFVVGDCNGTIKLYNFHHFALVQQISCEDMIDDICFSPDSKRLYDVRGKFCNIWEPNALIRVDETSEQDGKVGSEMDSVPTAAISEAFGEVRDQITAIAIQFGGRFQAIGDRAGVVSVVDSSEGDHVAIQLWRSPVVRPIKHLGWSCDGNYLACIEVPGKVVVKQVQLENGPSWTVTPVFEVKVDLTLGVIREVLLNGDGNVLLVKNGPSVTVWPLKLPPGSETRSKSITSPDTKWMKHPIDKSLLLAFSPSLIRVHLWEDLSEVAIFDISGPSLPSNPETNNTSDANDGPVTAAEVSSVFADPSCSHILMDTVLATSEGQVHRTYSIQTSAITPSLATPPASVFKPTPLPLGIQEQIEIPLGILPNRRLIFLDKDYWMCSWRLGAIDKVQRHYFIPKDWLSPDYLKLCALLADGRFVIPNNGELAVIRSTGMSQW